MAQVPSDDHDDEPPLAPGVERVRRRLARLMLGSIGVMVLGLIAVFAAIVYKLAAAPAAPEPAAHGAVTISLPDGAAVLATDLDGDRIMLRLGMPGGDEKLLILDRRSGEKVAEFDLHARP